MIPAGHALRASLALKLWSIGRQSEMTLRIAGLHFEAWLRNL